MPPLLSQSSYVADRAKKTNGVTQGAKQRIVPLCERPNDLASILTLSNSLNVD